MINTNFGLDLGKMMNNQLRETIATKLLVAAIESGKITLGSELDNYEAVKIKNNSIKNIFMITDAFIEQLNDYEK